MRRLLLLALCVTTSSTFATTADRRSRLDAIAKRLSDFKQQIDHRRAGGEDVSYPLVTYTVLQNFTGYCKADLNTSIPSGWGLNPVNGCNASYEPARDAHGGEWAAKIVNKTPQTPNVYAMFENSAVATLQADKPYTLSVWARGDDVGRISIPVDNGWNNRLFITGTSGTWQRFTKTFTPAQADCAFKARVLSESVTPGVFIDDVSLVAGDKPESGNNLIPNGDYETSWSAQRVARELPDMEKMADRLGRQLADAKPFPKVPRWDGATRPHIAGPSFLDQNNRPIFFVGYGHFEQVRKDIEKFPAYGINIVQHGEFGPKEVFPKENQTDDKSINNLIDELDRAAKAGVAVDFLISPHYFPDWMFTKYPHLRKGRADFFPYSIYAPEGRALVKRFVDYVIPKMKDKPALLSICLSNEPINAQDPDEFSTAAWRAWLKERHGDIATLNARWKSTYKSFEEVPQPNPLNRSSEARRGGAWCDFVRWNEQYFADFHKELAEMVHAIAPNLPVHAKATTWQMYRSDNIMSGDDPTLLGGVTDINGNDSVNLWSFNERAGDLIERGTKDFAQGWRENALGYELERSVHDAPVFNSENHLIFDRETRYVDPRHVRSALWMGAVHGQSATTLWVWEREKSNPVGDFAGDIMERPSCAEAVGVVCHDLNRVAPEITALQKAPPDVLILQSNTSAVWDGKKYDDALLKTFTALSFTGLKIGFVTEPQLEQGKSPPAKIVFVPNCIHLSDAAYKTLARHSRKLVLLGGDNVLTRNEYDQPREQRVSAQVIQTGMAWQDTLKFMAAPLREAHIEPAVQLKTDPLKPGVQWQTARTPQGLIVNLYNAVHDPVTVTIGNAGIDLLTGEKIAAKQKLTLAPMEVRLLRLPDVK